MKKSKTVQAARKTTSRHRHRPLPSNPEDLVRAMFRKADGKPQLAQGKKGFKDSPNCHVDEVSS